jgi:hypothetical protein
VIEVYLTLEEIQASIEFADNLQRNKIVDKKFDRNNSSWAVSLMGHLGEKAAAKVYGGDVDHSLLKGGDNGTDLTIDGITYQVKTSTTKNLIFNAAHLFTADKAILVQLIGDKTQPHIDSHFIVWGDIPRERFMQVYKIKNYGYGDRLVCDTKDITKPLLTTKTTI